MKKLVFALTVLCAITFTNAQDGAFKTDTKKLLSLTGAGTAFENAIAQLGQSVPEANKEGYTKEATTTLDPLYDKMADLYMQEFTQEELKELIAFYETELGSKLAEKQLALSQKAMAFGQNWGMEVQQIAQKHSK